jgi:hypothetical protein
MPNRLEEAKKILLGNRKNGYTLPTNNKLYPAQWNWDSAFIALGYSHFNLDFSITEIETLLDGQWDDGMVPHILFHEKDTSYFPNHTTWKCGKKIPSSGITQPPVLAIILKKIIENNQLNDDQNSRILKILIKIKKYHEWFIKFRDPNKTGLVSILHPWESGYDNSPIWDEPMSNILVDKDLNYQRRDLEVSNSDERPLKKDYDRYVTIRDQFRDVNYDPNKLYELSIFNVVDVGFNSLFLKANKDLVKLLKKFKLNYDELDFFISKSESEIIKLYNYDSDEFVSKDLNTNKDILIPSITNYFTLTADLKNDKLNKKIINNLKNHNLNEKYIFSTIKSDHQTFEEKRYWRGPVWINCNWLIYEGIKNKDKEYSIKIKNETISLIENKGFHEYYSCNDGSVMGANNFSWSAALYLDLVMQKNEN